MATDFTVDRDTVKYVLNSSGDIASVAIDTPAIEYNTDGTYKGLLVEPASTNLCKQSEDINTTWGTIGSTPTQSTEETPDGDTSNKYIKLIDDNGGGTGSVLVAQTIAVTAGTKYTASVFLKADQLAFAFIRAEAYDVLTAGDQFFGLSGAGSLGTASNLDDSSIEAYPNGWYRCSITWTQGASDTSFNLQIKVADSISNRTVDKDGTSSIFVWGAQVEASPIATSYIPTTTASVTRNADDISLTGASDLIGQSEGTIYVEVDWRLATGKTQFICRIDSSVDGGVLAYVRADANYNVIRFQLQEDSGVARVIDTGESSDITGIQKIAFAYASADSKFAINGTTYTPSTNNAFAFTETLDRIFFNSGNQTNQPNMWIRAVALYKTRLTNDQLADLTS